MLEFRSKFGIVPYDPFFCPIPRPDGFLPFEDSISGEVLFPRTIYAVPKLRGRCRGRVRCRTLPSNLVQRLLQTRSPGPDPAPLSMETHRSTDRQRLSESAKVVDPLLVSDWLSFGLRRLLDGQIEESIRVFKEVVSKYPFLHVAHRRLGLCHLMNHEETSALEELLKARTLQPRDVKTWFLLGVCHLRLQNVVMATLCLSKIVDSCYILLDVAADRFADLKEPPIRILSRPTILHVFNALVVRADIHHRTGDYASASEDLFRAYGLLETVKMDYSSLPVTEDSSGLISYDTIVTLNLALSSIPVKQAASARDLVIRLLVEIPQHARAVFVEGLCHEDMGELETAVATFSRSYGILPRPETLIKRAECKWKICLASNGQTPDPDPSRSGFPSWLNPGCLKDLETARKECDERTLSRILTVKAEIFHHLKMSRRFVYMNARRAVHLDPLNSVAWNILASTGRTTKETCSTLRRAIQSAPHGEDSFLKTMIGSLKSVTDDRFLEVISRSIELHPNDPSVFVQRGDVWNCRNRPENARDDYTKALNLIGLRNRVEVLLKRAEVFMRMDDLLPALSDLTEVVIHNELLRKHGILSVREDSRCLQPSVLMARVHHQMKRPERAVEELTHVIRILKEALENPPDAAAVRKGESSLEELESELAAAFYERGVAYASIENQFELAYMDFRAAVTLEGYYNPHLADIARYWMRPDGELENLLRFFVVVCRDYYDNPGFPFEAKLCFDEIYKAWAEHNTQVLIWTWERYFITSDIVDNVLATHLESSAFFLRHVMSPKSEEDVKKLLARALGKKVVCVAFVTTFWMWNTMSDLANEFYASVDFVKVSCVQMREFAERSGVLIYPTYQLLRLDGCSELVVTPAKKTLREKLVRYVGCL